MRLIDKILGIKDKHKGQYHVLNWCVRDDGGIHDSWEDSNRVAPGVLTWTICGQKVLFRGVIGDKKLAIKPPSIVQVSPKKIARIPECLVRQKLNATHKDLWQRLAPYAPVIVIAIGMIIIIIMVG